MNILIILLGNNIMTDKLKNNTIFFFKNTMNDLSSD